jgi:hypothetical protein
MKLEKIRSAQYAKWQMTNAKVGVDEVASGG